MRLQPPQPLQPPQAPPRPPPPHTNPAHLHLPAPYGCQVLWVADDRPAVVVAQSVLCELLLEPARVRHAHRGGHTVCVHARKGVYDSSWRIPVCACVCPPGGQCNCVRQRAPAARCDAGPCFANDQSLAEAAAWPVDLLAPDPFPQAWWRSDAVCSVVYRAAPAPWRRLHPQPPLLIHNLFLRIQLPGAAQHSMASQHNTAQHNGRDLHDRSRPANTAHPRCTLKLGPPTVHPQAWQ